MKKRGARINKTKYRADPPIVRSITDKADEIAIRGAVRLLAGGTDQAQTLDVILTHLHLLQMASDVKHDEQVKVVCEVAEVALDAIIERFRTDGTVTPSEDEQKAVELLMTESIDYWKRQSGMTRDACVQAVNYWYSEIEKQREAA